MCVCECVCILGGSTGSICHLKNYVLLLQELCKTVWRFLKKLKIELKI